MIAELLGTVVTGVLSGGATGLIGIALQQWGDSRKRADDLARLRLEHEQTRELARIEADRQLEVAKLAADSAERLADIALEARIAEGADLNYRASLAHDAATYVPPAALAPGAAQGRWGRFVAGLVTLMLGAVDFLRGLIRPGATGYSLALLTMLMLWVQDMLGRAGLQLTPEQVMRLTMEVIGTVTYLATTCTVWWFGVRPTQRR